LIERLEGDALTADDRRVLVKLITFHFWLLFALQEAKFGLKRLRAILFGEKPKKRQKQTSSSRSSDGGGAREVWEQRRQRRVYRRLKTTGLGVRRWPPPRPWASGR
jgi:hypothetical protein